LPKRKRFSAHAWGTGAVCAGKVASASVFYSNKKNFYFEFFVFRQSRWIAYDVEEGKNIACNDWLVASERSSSRNSIDGGAAFEPVACQDSYGCHCQLHHDLLGFSHKVICKGRGERACQ
jgi:hypothetical protein